MTRESYAWTCLLVGLSGFIIVGVGLPILGVIVIAVATVGWAFVLSS